MSKKSFKGGDNPAMAFITQPTQQAQHTDSTDNTENRSKRINMLLTPSLHLNLSKMAAVQLRSLNDLVNTALEAYVEDHQDLLEQYTKIWG